MENGLKGNASCFELAGGSIYQKCILITVSASLLKNPLVKMCVFSEIHLLALIISVT